jgi:hypothetical protein
MTLPFRSLAPEFAEELAALLLASNEPSLAEQILSAAIIARCECEDEFCASFYTAPLPDGGYGPGHDNIELEPHVGVVVLDVVHGRLMQVEVLHHPEFRERLRLALP